MVLFILEEDDMPTYYNIDKIDLWEYNRNIHFSKWHGFLASGDQVTKTQAAEIIIKTNNWRELNFGNCNSQISDLLERIYFDYLPVEEKISGRQEIKEKKFLDLFKIKESLHYLNNFEISNYSLDSWVDFDGTIFCDSIDIGKKCSFRDLVEDIKTIKKNFPYLNNITFQVLKYNISYPLRNKPMLTFKIIDDEILFSVDDDEMIHNITIKKKNDREYKKQDLIKIETAFALVYDKEEE
jgi:hypothetical protein